MLKRVLTLAAFAVVLLPASSFAVDHSKQWALGYYNHEAPVGVRYQFSEKAAFDFGLGFSSSEDVDFAATTFATKNFMTYTLGLGVPLTLVKTDHADFFFRPGILWQSVPYQLDDGTNPVSDERASNLLVELHLGGEWHVTDNLSLSVGHGVNIGSIKLDDHPTFTLPGKPESSSEIFSSALSITDLGFHWYFN